MAQQNTGDFNIIPASTTGDELAAILNRMNAADITMHSDPTAPAYKLNGMFWLDTTSATEHICKYYNSDNTTWIELFRVTIATGSIIFSSARVANSGNHLPNKTYTDAADVLKLNLTGGAVSGVITSSVPAVADNDLIRKVEAEALAGSSFPSGTVMLFYQGIAPTGWTQDDTKNDYMLRSVSGTGGGSDGTDSPISTHTHTTGNFTISTSTMPSHYHLLVNINGSQTGALSSSNYLAYDGATGDHEYRLHGSGTYPTWARSASTGSGATHNHGATGAGFTPKYIDIIIASKNA